MSKKIVDFLSSSAQSTQPHRACACEPAHAAALYWNRREEFSLEVLSPFQRHLAMVSIKAFPGGRALVLTLSCGTKVGCRGCRLWMVGRFSSSP